MPNYTATLQAAADELLRNTNEVYDECSDGIAELDRIIVSVAARRVEATRSYLIPILYAYWERFFRTAFTEYIRVLSDAAIGFSDCHVPIAVVRVRQELAAFARQAGAPHLHELSGCYSFEELSTLFDEFSSWLARPVQFRDPENWVSTDGNVQFKVLEKNCRIIGLDAGQLKASIHHAKGLFQALKDLVDRRNSIAHGQTFAPVNSAEWEDTKSFVLELMTALQLELYEHIRNPAKALGTPPTTAKPISAVRPGNFADEALASNSG